MTRDHNVPWEDEVIARLARIETSYLKHLRRFRRVHNVVI